MYITSDLFDSGPDSRSSDPHQAQLHSSTAELQPGSGTGKRKRRTDDDEPTITKYGIILDHMPLTDANVPLWFSNAYHQAHSSPNRTILLRQRHNYALSSHNQARHLQTQHESRPVKQPRRLGPKKFALTKSPSHLMDIEPVELSSSSAEQSPNSDLRPCHACHKAPTRRKDLENYLECNRCAKRACYRWARKGTHGAWTVIRVMEMGHEAVVKQAAQKILDVGGKRQGDYTNHEDV
ncbi:hypothetical protein CC78DRAFT_563772 [Lojkania enalia]|uniref:Uncharacterized protein n=1 Tax=Lojkania enalia TaxID=147567 RepID=A0A9P4NBU7_9PLEO|nr:hypothetical protein CC78DRAFT_563772 [Didymosphaeria enalia]